MLVKTHLAIGAFAIILFFPLVNNPFTFVIIALLATVLPDIDTGFSTIGKNRFNRLVQFFTEHRGAIHSLTFCLVLSLLLAVFIPVLAFGFFLGFSMHLLADSFTKMGIVPFWPYRRKAQGFLKTGGMVETGVFVVFALADLLLVMVYLF